MTGRVVLISGAAGGLGRAVVAEFLNQGARVWGLFAPGEANPFPEDAPAVLRADLSSAEQAAGAVRAVVQAAGRLDALVHLVGGFAGGEPLHQTSEESWRRMMTLNLDTAFHIIRAALPPMLEARQGRILAIGTRTAVEPAANLSAYNVSKAGLVALIRTVALEVKNAGVTANIVLPSVIDTPANRAANPNADYSRWVKPESIAALLAFLASDAASDINGAVIPIYGRA
jgi:NAD(P)-dependent dehydrogenase (short-subunit alcohol dehydrogenase family)